MAVVLLAQHPSDWCLARVVAGAKCTAIGSTLSRLGGATKPEAFEVGNEVPEPPPTRCRLRIP